jgi:hypothetical protein
MLRVLLASIALLTGVLAFTDAASAGGARTRIELLARMRSGAVEAKVAYREEAEKTGLRRKVQAEIYRAAPNAKYAVTRNGVQFATITTNELGNGRVEIQRTTLAMKAGDSVAVGKLSGVLAPKR